MLPTVFALRAERCDEVYREKASGKAIKGRPQLEKAIDALGTGDVLVVAEWDRATRSMMDGVHIIVSENQDFGASSKACRLAPARARRARSGARSRSIRSKWKTDIRCRNRQRKFSGIGS